MPERYQYDFLGLGTTADIAGDMYNKANGIGALGSILKFAGPAGMLGGLGLDVMERMGLFGKSEQEKRREWIEGMMEKANAKVNQGLRSRGSRFARARTLTGADRQAAGIRSAGGGRALKARQRLRTGLGAAGRGMAESVGGAIEGAADFDAANYLSAALERINQQAEAGALEESKVRSAPALAAMYSQPLQSHTAGRPNQPGYQEPIANAMDYMGAYWNARQRAQGTRNEGLFF